MDFAEIKDKAAAVARGAAATIRGAKKLREHLRQNPALEVMAAVAVGFLAGIALRAIRKRDE